MKLTCQKCNQEKPVEDFLRSKNPFAISGYLDLCLSCATRTLSDHNWSWEMVDKFCQFMDIPFIPDQFERAKDLNEETALRTYVELFFREEYVSLDWSQYFKVFTDLKRSSLLEDELPLLREEKLRALALKWGESYDHTDLYRLENMYTNLLATQNINGASEQDLALKYCRVALLVDKAIENGSNTLDKLISSYDKIAKMGEFTNKTGQKMGDFESVGELVYWLEKRGWVNNYYNNVPKDIVDETIQNMQLFAQRLYTGESGIGEEISRRIALLESVAELEDSNYDFEEDYDLDMYESDGVKLLHQLDGEFEVDLEYKAQKDEDAFR